MMNIDPVIEHFTGLWRQYTWGSTHDDDNDDEFPFKLFHNIVPLLKSLKSKRLVRRPTQPGTNVVENNGKCREAGCNPSLDVQSSIVSDS